MIGSRFYEVFIKIWKCRNHSANASIVHAVSRSSRFLSEDSSSFLQSAIVGYSVFGYVVLVSRTWGTLTRLQECVSHRTETHTSSSPPPTRLTNIDVNKCLSLKRTTRTMFTYFADVSAHSTSSFHRLASLLRRQHLAQRYPCFGPPFFRQLVP